MKLNEVERPKDSYVQSKRYAAYKDVLSVVLQDKKQYTANEVEKLLWNFLDKEV